MPKQKQPPDAGPQKDGERLSQNVGRSSAEGQPDARGNGASEPRRQGDRGAGPGKIGLTSDNQPDLVAPSGLNEGDHGAADDKPMAGGSVNLDDDDMVHPRGKTTAAGGTWKALGADSAPLGPPGAGLSDHIGPSDPDIRKQ
jgi:hypothetical protein